MEKIIVMLWITFGLYFSVFIGVMTDLWSGVRKAKINGVARSSYGYRRTIDKLANREFRSLWNKTLINENGYPFCNIEETISAVLGKNERDKTLSKTGKILVWILNKLDKNHCLKSIDK